MIFLKNMNSFTFEDLLRVFNLNKPFWLFLSFLSILSIIIFIRWLIELPNPYDSDLDPPQLDIISSSDYESLHFFSSFIIPLLSLRVESWPSIISISIFIFILSMSQIRNGVLHHNMLLFIFGYRIYSDEYRSIIISKKNLINIFNANIKLNLGEEEDHFKKTNYFKI